MKRAAIALGAALAVFGASALAPPAADAQDAPRKAERKASPQTRSKPSTKSAAKSPAKTAAANEPRMVAFDRLPRPIRALHSCAGSEHRVELQSVRYARATLFVVSCPAPRGKLIPFAVYLARDGKGTAAKRVTFEALAADGSSTRFDTLYSAKPAREAYTESGDPMPNMRRRSDVVWIDGAWGPEDRPGVCAVAAVWRVAGDKGELWLWEEARECPNGAMPKYEIKVDKKPPPLVEP